LKIAHADGSYPKLLAALTRFDLIVFDDWLRDALTLPQSQDLLDILDDRYGHSSTMVVTQIPVEDWHERIPDPTLADAILDRLVNNSYRLQLAGESQRRLRSSVPMSATWIYCAVFTGIRSHAQKREPHAHRYSHCRSV